MADLWLPKDFIDRERQRTILPLFRVSLGYEEVFGKKPSWSELFDRLKRYNLAQVLGVLGRISGVLDKLDRDHAEAQARICTGLFGERSRQILKAVRDWTEKEKRENALPSEPALFHELQLINFAKVAFLHLDPGPFDQTAPLEPLGEALLMLSNLLDAVSNEPDSDVSTPAGMKRWQQHFLANGLFHHGDTEVHALPRFYDIYLTDKSSLRPHPSYVDLPRRVLDVTGLEPNTLWAIVFALMAHWRNIELDSIAQGAWVMDKTVYFMQFGFSPTEINRFLSLVSTEIVTMKKEVLRLYSQDDLKPFHVLPFARWPLVEMDNAVFCVSMKLLKQKLTNGLHHLFLDPRFSSEERDQYLTFIGAVFEDYVERILVRVFPPSSGRLLRADELKQAVAGKSCDSAILYGDAVVLLETKATRFTLGARTEGNWDEYERQFQDIFQDSAAQIDNTIKACEDGRLTSLGIDPRWVRTYFPVIVTLEDLPMNRVIYRKVREDIDEAGLLMNPKAKALQAFDVGELEFLEIGLHAGRSLRDILEEKVSSEASRDESMGNYLIGRGESFILKPVNDYLGGLFKELGERAMQFFIQQRGKQAE